MKRVLSLILVVAMCIGLAACGSSKPAETQAKTEAAAESVAEKAAEAISEAVSEAAKEGELPYEGVKVGYCPPTLTDAWLALIADKMKEYCEAVGMEFIVADGNVSIETQIQETENFIAMGCDVIIAHPMNLDAFKTVCEKARAEGVKILYWADDPTTFEVEAVYLSVDAEMGKLCGEMALKWVDDNFPDAGKGDIKVAWITTQYDDRPTAKARMDSMLEPIQDDERFEVVFRKDNINTTVEAMDAMNECLALNPDINVVFTFADAMAMGANSAIMSDKSLDYSKIAVFGGAATDEGKALVDQSTDNKSVIRGLVTFGEGDAYFIKGAEIVMGVYDGTIKDHEIFFCDHDTYNTVGYVSDFNADEYAKEYVAKKEAAKASK